MECGATIGWDTLLRSVLRGNAGNDLSCLAIALNMSALSSGVIDCASDGIPVLTRYAGAVDDRMVFVQPYSLGDAEHISCEDVGVSLIDFASALVQFRDGGGTIVFTWDSGVDDPSCDQTCHDYTLTEMLLGAIVRLGNGDMLWRITPAGFDTPIACNSTDAGFESLARAVMQRVGDGKFAFRYVQEA